MSDTAETTKDTSEEIELISGPVQKKKILAENELIGSNSGGSQNNSSNQSIAPPRSTSTAGEVEDPIEVTYHIIGRLPPGGVISMELREPITVKHHSGRLVGSTSEGKFYCKS